MSNDRGTWSVTTPGAVQIEASKPMLRITCRHDDFRDETVELPCVSRRTRATMTGASAGLGLASAGAAAATAAPAGFAVGPAAPVVITAVVVSAVVGGGAGYALAGADTYRCEFDIAMTPLP